MISIFEVNETNKMIEQENLDVRTITLGISLLDCIDSDLEKLNEKIYNKITTYAKDLVATGEKISAQYGIPIVNKRISVTPIGLVGGAACKTTDDFVTIARTLDKAAKQVGVNFIGGYTALVSKGMTPAEELLIRSIPQALASTERVCSSVNVGSTKTGINMDAVKLMGEIILETAQATKEQDSLGCAKLVVFCNAPDDNPFMAGAFHGVTEADSIINVGVSGPGVVKTALEKVRGEDFETLCEMIKRTAFKVTRVGQLVAREASKMLGVPFGIVDLSLAPTPAIGDSVAEILEEIGLERAGAPGTTAALALLNDQVKKGGVMASTAVGGLSGAFIPVSEDQGMIDAVTAGALTIEKLEAMTCVCSVGLDMIAVPGDTKASTISGIIADEAAIGMVNQKTTAVRLIPVIGKGVGETVEFGGLLGYAPIMPVNNFLLPSRLQRPAACATLSKPASARITSGKSTSTPASIKEVAITRQGSPFFRRPRISSSFWLRCLAHIKVVRWNVPSRCLAWSYRLRAWRRLLTITSICGCSASLASRSASVCVPMCCTLVRRSLSKSAVGFGAISRTFSKPR